METIGQYRVTGLIGQGGMGAVYAAEHTLLGRPAAIKVLLPELSQKQDVVLRFFNEARAATAIRHPGIIEIYDFGWTPEGAAFIVMEHLEGETLGRRASRARFRWQSALAIARQIAGALAAAHGKGIVHRDLKPDNIFLVPDPEVPGGERIKLLDFGIAKLAGESSSSTPSVTKTGAVMGTPTYMAPEQCRGVAVDHRVDLYALGCIVFELCSGRPPFVGEGTGDVLAAHIHVPVPRLATLSAEVPAPVEELIRRLLAKSPAQRVQSAEELIRAIDAVATERAHSINELSSGEHPAPASSMVTTLSGAASTSRLLPAFTSRRGRLITVVSAVVLTIAAFVIVAALRGRGEEATKVVSYSTIAHPAGASPSSVEAPAPGAPTPPATDPPARSPAPAGTELAQPSPGPAGPVPARTEPAAQADQPGRASAESAAQAGQPAHASAESAAQAGQPGRASAESAAQAGQPAHASAESAAQAERPATAHGEPDRPAPAPVEPARPPAEPAPHPPVVAPRPQAPPQERVDVTFDSNPSGATVMIAGKPLGKTPFHGALPRRNGDVTVVVRLAGYADRTVVVRAGQPFPDVIKLVKVAPPRPPRGNRDQSVNPFGD